eukprot:875429_1
MADKQFVPARLLNIGYSKPTIQHALERTVWIQGNTNKNLQNVIELITSRSEKKQTQKQNISPKDTQTNVQNVIECISSRSAKKQTPITHCNSDLIQPRAKKRKLSHSNEHKTLYSKIIHLLNCGKISYANSKRDIRQILAKEYNLNAKDLKKNKEFKEAIQRLMAALMDDHQNDDTNELDAVEPSQSKHKSQNIHKSSTKPKTLRDCKAELSSKSRGCPLHGLGHHITFKQDALCLYMSCDLCDGAEIQKLRLPMHLRVNMNGNNTNNDRKRLNEWNCHEIVHWMNRVDDGALNDVKYMQLKRQIIIGNINGSEVSNINETTLKMAEIQTAQDRELVLKYLLDLIAKDGDVMMKAIAMDKMAPIEFYDPISFEIMKDPVL